MHKLRSFTLFEIVVVMAISTFVVSISWAVYELINVQFVSYKRTNEKIKELYQFTNAIQNDFEEAYIISGMGKDVNFEMKNNLINTYTFYDDCIVRKNKEIRDTFKINVIGLEKYYNGIAADYGIIDELNFDSDALDNSQEFSFFKKYESDVLIEQEKTE